MANKSRKQIFDPEDILKEAIKDINKKKYSDHKPLNIIDFAEKFTERKLFPSQEIILKWFYAGTRYNKDIEINNEDLDYISSWEIDQTWLFHGDNNKLKLLKEYQKDKNRFFTDLVLVLGRRSGKTFMTALIATYEAYKLICLGDPQGYYEIPASIWIINAATTKEQATTEIFSEIKKFVYNCPIFDGRIGHDIDGYLYIRTDADLEKNEKIKKYGGKELKGSIVIAAGSSNSRGLRGHSAIMCLAPETLIDTDKGLVRISDKKIFNYNIKGKDGYRKIDELITRKDDLYRVCFNDGSFVKCTLDHKFFVLDENNNIKYKKVKDIKKDVVLQRKKLDFPLRGFEFEKGKEIKDQKSLFRFFGFLTNFQVDKLSKTLTYIFPEETFISQYKDLVPKEFENYTSFYENKYGTKIYYVSNSSLLSFMKDNSVEDLVPNNNSFIPDFILRSNKENIVQFLIGLFCYGNYREGLYFETFNDVLAKDIYTITKGFNLDCYIENKDGKYITVIKDEYNFEKVIEGKEVVCQIENIMSSEYNYLCKDFNLNTIVKIERYKNYTEVYDVNFKSEDHSFYSDSFLSHNCVYDELAHFVEGESSQKSTSEEVYNALSPSCITFSHKGDGRNVSISTPDLAQGFFYKHFIAAKDNEGFLLFQLPTWNVNPRYPKGCQYIQNAYKKDFDRANSEYGARFRMAAGNSFFPWEKIEEAFDARDNWYKHKKGIPGLQYYMHLDPASTSDRYAVMIAHPERRYSHKLGYHVTYVIEDFSAFFVPPAGGFLDPDDIIDSHIFPLFDKFNIVSVTYDAMFSLEQQKKFNRKGINHREISFKGYSKNRLYETALDFFINNRIVLCRDDEQLKGELKSILINYRDNRPKIVKNEGSEYPTDDLVDCLCGVINAISTGQSGQTKLPRVGVARTGYR